MSVPNLRDLAYAFGVTVTSPIWGLSLLRTGKWRTDWKGRYGHAVPLGAHDGKTLLFNAVSVGEVSLLRGLIEELAQREPTLRMVIAATTNTGFKRATELYGQRHTVVRYPLDFSWVVRRFLKRINPDAVCAVELEVWPNFVEACEALDIPLGVVNGRLSARSFKGYVKFKRLIGPSFRKLAFAAVQTEDYAERFKAMGVKDVHVLDTMKWDNAVIEDGVEAADALAGGLGIDRGKPVVAAGSTGPGEDKLLIEALSGCPGDTQLIIAPRKPEWFDDAAKAAADAGLGCVRRTDHKPGKGPVYLLDTIGELRKAYALADVVVVGRSFLGLYGSDVMEPAALGKPVIIGRHHKDFQDVVDAMHEAGGLIVTDDPGQHIRELLEDREKAQQVSDAGRAVIRDRQGSTSRHADMILALLKLRAGARSNKAINPDQPVA